MTARPNWFIALPVDAGAVPVEWLATIPAGLQRFHPDDLHVTVAFLGAVDEHAAHRAWAGIGTPAGLPLWPRPRRVRAFGRPERPSAYGLEVDDDRGSVAAFIGEYRDGLRAAAGLEAETRTPVPHVTLARPPRRAGAAIHGRARRWLARAEVPDVIFTLDRLALYTRSRDRREGLFVRVAERAVGD